MIMQKWLANAGHHNNNSNIINVCARESSFAKLKQINSIAAFGQETNIAMCTLHILNTLAK